jgi:hypothetical protein
MLPRGGWIRVRVEIMGSQKCGIVGESQPVLMMINPIIFTRTRTDQERRVAGRELGAGREHAQPLAPPDVAHRRRGHGAAGAGARSDRFTRASGGGGGCSYSGRRSRAHPSLRAHARGTRSKAGRADSPEAGSHMLKSPPHTTRVMESRSACAATCSAIERNMS